MLEHFIQNDEVYFLFSNEASRADFLAFLDPRGNVIKQCSIIQLARSDFWMTCVFEDMKLKCEAVLRSGSLKRARQGEIYSYYTSCDL